MPIVQGLNDLQFTTASSWSGLTTDNHLFMLRQNDIQLESDVITQIHSQYMGKYGWDNLLGSYPTKYFDTDADYKWNLMGERQIAVPIIGFSATDNTKPGVGKSIFQLTVAENRFQNTEHLFFDDLNFSVRIVGDGYANGSGGWTYPVKHMKPSMTHFIPPSLMTSGNKVNRMFNSDTNTLGKDYSGMDYNSNFEMRNVFSTQSKEMKVPGNMWNRPMLIGFNVPGGSVEKIWTRYQDLEMEWQWRQEINRNLIYSEFNMEDDGTYSTLASSGFPVKQGAGLRQQISPSYKIKYNVFNLDLLAEIGINLSVNILPEDQRKFVMLTGERGMYQFSKACEDKAAIFQPLDNGGRIFGSGQDLGIGGQFRRFKAYNGVEWTVVHMPEYDNPHINRIPHPEGGYTENYRYTIFNVGTTQGQPNIQKVAPRNRDLKWYVAGGVNPMGPTTGLGASKVDGYEIYRRTTHGIMLRNPLSACELIPNVI